MEIMKRSEILEIVNDFTEQDMNNFKKIYKEGYKYFTTHFINGKITFYAYKEYPELKNTVRTRKGIGFVQWEYNGGGDYIIIDTFDFLQEYKIKIEEDFKTDVSKVHQGWYYLIKVYNLKRILQVSGQYFNYKNISDTYLEYLESLYLQGFKFIAVEKQEDKLTYFAYKYKPLCSINVFAELMWVDWNDQTSCIISPDDYDEITFDEDINYKYTDEVTKTKINDINFLPLKFDAYKIKDILENIREAGIKLNIKVNQQGSKRYKKIKIKSDNWRKIQDLLEENNFYYEEL